ncbi:hypothetical protein AN964_16620 [Heyndrickxia shackletonii]|uniref:Uncharacterized protein n=1 Tax=Heyndrickxia shackletonii TaxID=157838 RepID=A0A0Q3WZI2_9BACI|nr:hypothetical protein AN964_16620 [Heyndrickxia shackletonii]
MRIVALMNSLRFHSLVFLKNKKTGIYYLPAYFTFFFPQPQPLFFTFFTVGVVINGLAYGGIAGVLIMGFLIFNGRHPLLLFYTISHYMKERNL